jgi:hypothetical protein
VAPPGCDSSVAEPLIRNQQSGVRFSAAAPCDRTQTVRGLSVEQVLMSSTLIGHSKIVRQDSGPVAQWMSAAPSEGAGHRFKSDQGLHAGVAQWQSSRLVCDRPESDSRRRLHRCGARAAAHPALTRRGEGSSPFAPTKILAVVKVSDTSLNTKRRTDCSLREKICPVSSEVERRSYKPEVGDSNPPRGTRFGRVVITGALRSCKPEVGIRLPPRPPD